MSGVPPRYHSHNHFQIPENRDPRPRTETVTFTVHHVTYDVIHAVQPHGPSQSTHLHIHCWEKLTLGLTTQTETELRACVMCELTHPSYMIHPVLILFSDADSVWP